MTRSIGLSLPNRGVLFGATTVEELLTLTEQAEESGFFDSVWVGDGLIAKPRLEAISIMSALASRTSRVKLGVCCMATFPLRNPVLLACQWASLDVISGGRSLLAVCLGAPTGRGGANFGAELQAMGVTGKERVGRLEEGIDLIRRLWAGPTSQDGRYWKFPTVDLEPKPVQDPCPIWIASNPNPSKLTPERYERAIVRVAELADGWMSTVVTPAEFGTRWADIKRLAKERGRNVSSMESSVHLMINIQDDETTARREAKRFLDEYYSTDTKSQVMNAWGAYGPPDHVIARIKEYRAEGADIPIIRFASFDQKGQLERAMDELLPELTA